METLEMSWKEFNENSCATIRNLYEDKQFGDVTLASQDEGEILCHRVVLASSSPFFKRMLSRNSDHSNPIIFLKGVAMKQLEAVIKFIYLGETIVLKEDINSFLETAETLEIRGLASIKSVKDQEDESQQPFEKRRKKCF